MWPTPRSSRALCRCPSSLRWSHRRRPSPQRHSRSTSLSRLPAHAQCPSRHRPTRQSFGRPNSLPRPRPSPRRLRPLSEVSGARGQRRHPHRGAGRGLRTDNPASARHLVRAGPRRRGRTRRTDGVGTGGLNRHRRSGRPRRPPHRRLPPSGHLSADPWAALCRWRQVGLRICPSVRVTTRSIGHIALVEQSPASR